MNELHEFLSKYRNPSSAEDLMRPRFSTFIQFLNSEIWLNVSTTPWLLVRKRTIPTERPPLVDEVNANFCG
jgi:hypothetical protein